MTRTGQRKILILDDQADYLRSLTRVLQSDYDVKAVSSYSPEVRAAAENVDLLLLDIRLDETDAENREGLDVLKEIRRGCPGLPIVMMTAFEDIDTAIQAMRLGASDFILKSRTGVWEINKVIQQNLSRARLEKKVSELQESLSRLEPVRIIGQSSAMETVRRQAEIAATDGHATILIEGATGTGKELVARAIHSWGRRRDDAFVPVAIASLSRSLVESELFGHEKGAFSGADARHIGYMEKANGGTLFLDEIGDLDTSVQVKLLRFLENKRFCRVGSTEEIQIDVQLIAATLHNVEDLVRQNRFREDLYFRLKTMRIMLPPVVDRHGDVARLARSFLDLFRLQGRTEVDRFDDQTLACMNRWHWPGNVRELKGAVERAVIYANFHGHDSITPDDLPLDIRTGVSERMLRAACDLPEEGLNLDCELMRLELRYIEQALVRSSGKKTEAWKLLGYNDRYTIGRKVKMAAQKFPGILAEFEYLSKQYEKKD